ncbi:MAG: hypothetical protein SWK76_14380 [Actinomycetota bacterium]|nr:hypothetical protein [Actinomycetota bacterium]
MNYPGIRGEVVHSYDITDRKRLEQELEHSEDYFRSLIENASDMVSSTMDGGQDPDYETTYAYYDSGELKSRVTEASSATYTYDVSGRLAEIEDTALKNSSRPSESYV